MEFPEVVAAVGEVATGTTEQAVLESVVAACRDLAGAGFAVAVLLGPDGEPCAVAYTGTDVAGGPVLPHLPRPVGASGQVLTGARLRLTRLGGHPGSVGLLAARVPVDALLGIPVSAAGQVLGGLYLTRPPGQSEFSDADETVAGTLAALTGSRVAGLRGERAARDLVDAVGLTRDRMTDPAPDADGVSPVVRRILSLARSVIGLDLTFLSRIEGGTQTFTAVDAGPGAPPLAEGTVVDVVDGYCRLMLDGAIPASVADVSARPELAGLPVTTAGGVGAYCGVPVRLPDGSLHGTLCGLHGSATQPPTPAQMQAMGIIADMLGARLAVEREDVRARERRRDAFVAIADGPRSRIVVQPIVDLADGRVAGFEALSRFTDVTGAPWQPDLVFAAAGDVGVGIDLELRAARAALALLPELPADTYLSVNVSPRAVCDPRTAELFTGVDLDRVVVELTEHEQVADYAAVVRALSGLRSCGLRLAIDDTGSGYAGLQHLAELGPDIIKLDIAFVRGVDRDPARRAVARAVIGFATDVGATLVAEGIETQAELDELRGLGAHLGQGYLLARPGELSEAIAAPALTRLGVMPMSVVDAGDGWVAGERGVGAVVVVGVEPVWQGGGAVR